MRLLPILFLILFSPMYAVSEVDQLISEASAHNTYFLYKDAVQFLDEAIKLNPYEKEAYKERALSYFELNRIDLALEDYKRAIDPSPPYKRRIRNCSLAIHPATLGEVPPSLDFANGLLYGTLLGGREGSIQFVSSVRGGLTFLWSFACSPIDVSKELIEALHDIGEFLASGRVDVLLQEALPELFECREYWHSWSEYTKGQKLGFIIGKYSILAFYYLATADFGIHFYNNLRRANIMAILGRYSVTRSTHILEASAKHAKKSTSILKKATGGSIIPHNPNVLPHIFTKKHRWDKFIKLSGNLEKDFDSLVLFLERQGILQCEREIDWAHKSVTTYKYTKEIGRDKITAIFEINKENLPLLRNAWVEIGAPYVP
ncbi:MAG: tetratricopeptide repeat protein [Simkaniaceae bacterium]|nr:tetratricopeptide repeat protein [Candidatus Sacchlamyda saccharinae]